jgi:hypothetical protein
MLRYLWASPNTLIGLAFALAGLASLLAAMRGGDPYRHSHFERAALTREGQSSGELL